MSCPTTGQIGLARPEETGRTTPGRNKYGPNGPGAGFSRVDDPDDANRSCALADSSSGTIAAYERLHESASQNGMASDDFSMDWVELFEVRVALGAGFQAGGGGQAIFFQSRLDDGAGGIVSVSLDHTSTGGSYRGRLVASAITGGSNTTWASNDKLPVDTWCTVMIRVNATAGQMNVWKADKKMEDVNPSTDFTQVITNATFTPSGTRGARKNIRFPGNTDSAGGNETKTWGRKSCWGTWHGSVSDTFNALKFKHLGCSWGAEYPSNTAGKRAAQIKMDYDMDLWLRATSGLQIGFEIATDANFSNIVQTISRASASTGRRTTQIDNLDENTTYYARANVRVNPLGSTVDFNSETAILKTKSSTTPSQMKFIYGGCKATGANNDPAWGLTTALRDHSDAHGCFIIGDIGYLDVELRGQNLKGELTEDTILTEFRRAGEDDPIQQLARYMPVCVEIDDHECPSMYLDITAISTGAGSVTITTNGDHGLSVGDIVTLENTNSTPAINHNIEVVTVPTSNTFTVNRTVTVAGTSGQMIFPGVGFNGRGTGKLHAWQYNNFVGAWNKLFRASMPASTSNQLGSVPSGNHAGGSAYTEDDVFWYFNETAKCAFAHIQCRMYRDPLNEDMLGPDQLADLLDFIQNTTKPLLVISSPDAMTQHDRNKRQSIIDSTGTAISRTDLWGSDGTQALDYMDQRDEILQAIYANSNIKKCIIIEADNHRAWITSYHGLLGDGINSGRSDKIIACGASAYTSGNHGIEHLYIPDHPDYGTLGENSKWENNSSTWDALTVFGKTSNQNARVFLTLNINEVSETAEIEIWNGETGASGGYVSLSFGDTADLEKGRVRHRVKNRVLNRVRNRI